MTRRSLIAGLALLTPSAALANSQPRTSRPHAFRIGQGLWHKTGDTMGPPEVIVTHLLTGGPEPCYWVTLPGNPNHAGMPMEESALKGV